MSREIDKEFRQRTFRLLEAFVYDYLRKSGCIETARTYFEEAQLDDWPPPWLEQLVTPPISPATVPPSSSIQLVQVKEEENLNIKSECVINDSALPPELNHEAIINSHMAGSDYFQYSERSPSIISATSTHEELPDLLLPLEGQDGFLQDWWCIVWENYKTMFERQTGIEQGCSPWCDYSAQPFL
ncbi:9352_t:CDS:2 [Scutellospora calospora]|uniref:9352_t:CDS:1 n=1 Tax=Scutellospora calospora TaxID=85575 RepID=A0ACA9KAB1_9GLOM|nr:9352_t:CDS:2 [Scutellospora calospora]